MTHRARNPLHSPQTATAVTANAGREYLSKRNQRGESLYRGGGFPERGDKVVGVKIE